MDAEIAAVAAAVVPYLTAAAGAYGAAVLSRIHDSAADTTVGFGSRLLRRLLQREDSAPALESAVLDLAEDPADNDRQAALRLQIRKILAADEELAADVSGMINGAEITITASGDRAVAGQHISGVVITGDITETAR